MPIDPEQVQPVDPTDPAVAALVELHLRDMHAGTPAGFAFALGASGLGAADITLLGVRSTGGALAGIGAIRELSPVHGELKSMRTAPTHLRQGVAQALLAALLALARERGYERVSLETGTTPAFAAAIALYERAGFVPCGPFGDYAASDHNRFLTLAL